MQTQLHALAYQMLNYLNFANLPIRFHQNTLGAKLK
jgi:hypothetical protein